MSDSDKAQAWRVLARRACLKFNFGWWLDRLTPWLIGTALIGAVALVAMRTMHLEIVGWIVAASAAGAVLVLGIVAWLLARRRFIGEAEALVRLESHLHLRNALTTASHGISSWPDPPRFAKGTRYAPSGLRWRWSHVLAPFIAAILVVAAGLFVPVEGVAKKDDLPPSEPLAWEQMENWLDTIEETEIVEPEAIEMYREDIKELRDQPQGDWFSHSSMEASDSLRDALGREVRQMGADLSKAERDLNVLQNFADQLNDQTRGQLMEEYKSAVQGLELGKLPLNSELMEMMKGLDPSQLSDALSQLSEEQLQQLREQLKKGAAACKECQGSGSGLGELSESEQLLSILNGKDGKDGDGKPGRGGINRGRGDAPMSYGDEQDIDAGNLESVTNPDLSRAAPGDVLGVGNADHQVKEVPVGPTQGGAVSGTGQGGDAVWRESLLPEEKAVLKKYFR